MTGDEKRQQMDKPQPALPAAGEPVRFEQHIKPLFRPYDRQAMSFAFDLWSYDDVSQHAEAILGQLQAGTMPCAGAWPQEKIDVFSRWADAGKPALSTVPDWPVPCGASQRMLPSGNVPSTPDQRSRPHTGSTSR